LLNHLILLSSGLRGYCRFFTCCRLRQKLGLSILSSRIIWRSGRPFQVAKLCQNRLFRLKWYFCFRWCHDSVRYVFKKITKMSSQRVQFFFFLLFRQFNSFLNNRLPFTLGHLGFCLIKFWHHHVFWWIIKVSHSVYIKLVRWCGIGCRENTIFQMHWRLSYRLWFICLPHLF
jgi:hypothetical protein